MEQIILENRRKSPRVPAELTVLGEVEDRRLAMRSANISRDGMFLFSREFVPPHVLFSAQVCLENDQEPLRTYMTPCFIESTWNGYGIGVFISGISSEDSARWESFYQGCLTADADKPALAQSEAAVGKGHILVVGSAVHPLAMQTLRAQGLEVTYVATVDEALALLRRDQIDVVVSDLRRPGLDGLALCCYVKSHQLKTHTVLLTSSSTPREFLLGLYAGAARVISKPSGNDILVSRIQDLLRQRLPARRRPSADDLAFRPTDEAIIPLSVARSAAVVGASAGGHIAQRVSQRVSQACRYISARLSRRQVA